MTLETKPMIVDGVYQPYDADAGGFFSGGPRIVTFECVNALVSGRFYGLLSFLERGVFCGESSCCYCCGRGGSS